MRAAERIRQNPMLVTGLLLVIILVFGSLSGAVLGLAEPSQHGDLLLDRYKSPSSENWFGTDKFGRDVFSRVLYGGRISLSIAVSVMLLSLSFGLFYGAFAAFRGGRTGTLMMRLLDFLLAVPLIFLVIALLAVTRLNHWYLIPILAFTGWMESARIVYGEVLSLKKREYVTAARLLGFSDWRILFVHILPQCLFLAVALAPLKVAEFVLLESALSFLGIGVQPPVPSWGNIINDGRSVLFNAWWIATFPGIFITLTVIGFHMIAKGLQRRLL